MKNLDQYGLDRYVQWKDFTIEKLHTTQRNMIVEEFFFRSPDTKALLGYIKLHISFSLCIAPLKESITYFSVIDTISASNFEKIFTKTRQEFFRKHGYQDNIHLTHFWPTMLTSVLAFVKQDYPKSRLVNIVSKQKNLRQIWSLVDKTKQDTSGLINKICGWGSDTYEVTVFLK